MSDKKIEKAILITIGLTCVFFIFNIYILPRVVPCYKCASPCSQVESDANNIAAAIVDYFSIPERIHITPKDVAGEFNSSNSWTFTKCGQKIYIYVYDRNEACSMEYQKSQPEWNSHIYTKVME